MFPNGIAINDGLTDELDGVYVRDVEKEESELSADWQKRRIAKSEHKGDDDYGDDTGRFDVLKEGAIADRTDGLFADKTWQVCVCLCSSSSSPSPPPLSSSSSPSSILLLSLQQ